MYLTNGFQYAIVYSKLETGVNMIQKPDPNWKYPAQFEAHPRIDKCKPRTGNTRKLRGLINKAKSQGIVIASELVKFEENVTGSFYIYNLELSKRLTPKFRTVNECIDVLEDFIEAKV